MLVLPFYANFSIDFPCRHRLSVNFFFAQPPDRLLHLSSKNNAWHNAVAIIVLTASVQCIRIDFTGERRTTKKNNEKERSKKKDPKRGYVDGFVRVAVPPPTPRRPLYV